MFCFWRGNALQVRNLVRIKPARLRLLRWKDMIPTLLIMSGDADEETRARAGEALETVWRNATLDAGDLGEGKSLLEQDTACDITETICTISDPSLRSLPALPAADPAQPLDDTARGADAAGALASNRAGSATPTDLKAAGLEAARLAASPRLPATPRNASVATALRRLPATPTRDDGAAAPCKPEEAGRGPPTDSPRHRGSVAAAAAHPGRPAGPPAPDFRAAAQAPRSPSKGAPAALGPGVAGRLPLLLRSPDSCRGCELGLQGGPGREDLFADSLPTGRPDAHRDRDPSAAAGTGSPASRTGRANGGPAGGSVAPSADQRRPRAAGGKGTAGTRRGGREDAEGRGRGGREAGDAALFGDPDWPPGWGGEDSGPCGGCESRVFSYVFDAAGGLEAAVTADGELVAVEWAPSGGGGGGGAAANEADHAETRRAGEESEGADGNCHFEEELRPLFEAVAGADDAAYAAFSAAALRRALLRPARIVLPSQAAARSAAEAAVGQGLRALLRWARAGFGGDAAARGDAVEAVDAAARRLPDGNVRLRWAVAGDGEAVQVRQGRLGRAVRCWQRGGDCAAVPREASRARPASPPCALDPRMRGDMRAAAPLRMRGWGFPLRPRLHRPARAPGRSPPRPWLGRPRARTAPAAGGRYGHAAQGRAGAGRDRRGSLP